MSQFSLSFLPERQVYSVSEITAKIRDALESDFSDIWIDGEISNFRRAASGHLYFILKDADAQLRCVFFRQDARLLRFRPDDGLAVRARGRLTVYESRGEYQLLVQLLEPLGAGALQLAFEQLKKKLADEGLFDPDRKRPLPLLPRRIGLVTSPTGAVIADMIRILRRRFPGLHLRLYPVRVQGDGAAEDITEAIRYFNRGAAVDLLIIGRGGGSLEDLWPFNTEIVARAIAASTIPVISAVGHETDFTIADFVADLRAPTPSAAAELAVRTRDDFSAAIGNLQDRLGRAARYRLAMALQRLTEIGVERPLGVLRRRLARAAQRTDELDYRLRDRLRRRLLEAERRLRDTLAHLRAQDPRRRLAERRARLAQLNATLATGLPQRLALLRGRLDSLAAQLGQLSPVKVLERGYALVQDEHGRLLRRATDAVPGQSLRVRLHEGRLVVEVRDIE
jgi:exodeoxyribonuclease VII large subunit